MATNTWTLPTSPPPGGMAWLSVLSFIGSGQISCESCWELFDFKIVVYHPVLSRAGEVELTSATIRWEETMLPAQCPVVFIHSLCLALSVGERERGFPIGREKRFIHTRHPYKYTIILFTLVHSVSTYSSVLHCVF